MKMLHLLFFQRFCNSEKNQGVVSSLLNWVTSGVTLPTYLEKSSCAEFSWLTYFILWLEGNFEIKNGLWKTMHEELLNHPKAGTEQGLKVYHLILFLDISVKEIQETILYCQQTQFCPEDPVIMFRMYYQLILGFIYYLSMCCKQTYVVFVVFSHA